MGNGRHEFLQKYTDGERWVWLALRLEELGDRLRAVEAAAAGQAAGLSAVERRCAARRWHGAALKGLLGAAAGALAAAAGCLLDRLWSAGR